MTEDQIPEEPLTEEQAPIRPEKKIVTVYIPVDILNEARARGINVSRAATDGLRIAIMCDKGYKQVIDKIEIFNNLEKEDKSEEKQP